VDPVAQVAATASIPSASRLRGAAWAACALAIFAGWFVVTRLSITHELRIWDIVALRFGIGAIVLLPVLVVRRRALSPRDWREGFLLSLLWGAPFVIFVGGGLQLTSAEQASSVTPGLMPILTGLIAWALLDERPAPLRIAGYAVILAGLVLLLLPGWLRGRRADPWGLLALALAALLWACYALRVRCAGLVAPVAAAFVCFWSALVYVPLYVASGVSRLADAPMRELLWQSFYQGVLMSGIAIFAFNRAVGLLGPVTAASVFGLVPVVVAVLAIPVLGEWPTPSEALAVAAVAIGVALAARGGASPKSVSPAAPSGSLRAPPA
jgi:drug/metabolite transporter (DMT)-like permease